MSVKGLGLVITFTIPHNPHARPVADAAVLALACGDSAERV